MYNTVINNIYITPAKKALSYVNSVVIEDHLLTVPSYQLSSSRHTLITALFTYVITNWLTQKYGVPFVNKTPVTIWLGLPITKTITSLITDELIANLSDIDVSRHGRRIWCDTYIVGPNIHVLIRSCNQFN